MRAWHALFVDRAPLVDRTNVTVYASAPAAGQQPLPPADAPRPAVSLVATVRNEGAGLDAWLESVLAQTRRPDEIVIVDGGSTDDTFARLQAFAARAPLPVRVWQASGANIARGRNLAIERAAGPLIACTDAGCELTTGWLAAVTGPFAADPALEVAAGYYAALQTTDFERVTAAYLVPPLTHVDPRTFLPSTRSVAFRKEAWRAVGGFPEWLTLTAEDTLFGVALKARPARWAFVPEAGVRWHLRPTWRGLWRQVRRYGQGDGEAGLFPARYREHLRLLATLALALALALAAVAVAGLTRQAAWLLAALPPGLWLARRLWRLTLRPRFQLESGAWWPSGPGQTLTVWLLSALVALTIPAALCAGFLAAARDRAPGRPLAAVGSDPSPSR
ncbi:MAG: glycosyltransferase [Anaerolineales bacterium]|nr:glycosyltransferase [Anaerolineales bacterium]